MKDGWEQTKGRDNFQDKLHLCGELISKWAEDEIGNTRKKIQQLSEEIDNLQEADDNLPGEEDIKLKERHLEKLLLQEEMHWHQRSKLNG